MQKDFITITPDSGSGNKDITVQASQNDDTSQRSSTITITGGGMTRGIKVTQSGRTPISVLVCGDNGYIEKLQI